jgi:hypothetical protein
MLGRLAKLLLRAKKNFKWGIDLLWKRAYNYKCQYPLALDPDTSQDLAQATSPEVPGFFFTQLNLTVAAALVRYSRVDGERCR